MRKVLVLLALVFAVVGAVGVAGADTVCTAAGCASVNENGYIAVLDGDAGNPDPLDGFISVDGDGTVCADDNGTADDRDSTNGPESTSPTCS